jgi:hypothetical protein
VVTAAIHEQVESADVQIGKSRHVTLHEPGRHPNVGCLPPGHLQRISRHLDADSVPSVRRKIDGVATGSAAEIEGAARLQPIWPLNQLDQSVIGHI